jgi:predicted PurR-regulated permease PerM
VAAILAVVAALVLVTWKVPLALVTVAGGLALATVLSFPVRLLSRLMPRRSRGLAVVLTFMAVAALIALTALFVVPQLAQQFETLTEVLSSSLTGAERYLLTAFEFWTTGACCRARPSKPSRRSRKTSRTAPGRSPGAWQERLQPGLGRLRRRALPLRGGVRRGLPAGGLPQDKVGLPQGGPDPLPPRRQGPLDAFEHSFSRYLSGLLLDLFIQGAVSALVLYLIGVPYAIALGAWVFLTGIIPYAGAWLGAIPAVAVALTVSPTATILTLVAFL